MRKAVLKRPGEAPEVITIDPAMSLETLQAAVGGLIERANTSVDDVFTVWCNEEGLLQGLAPNLSLGGLIVGPVVFEGLADEEGETLGLTDDEVAMAIKLAHYMAVSEASDVA